MQSLSRCVSGPSGVTRSRLSVVVVRPLRGVAIAGTSAYDDRRSRDRYSYGHIYITPRVNRIPRRLDSASACALLDRSLAVAAHKAMLSASLMFSVGPTVSLSRTLPRCLDSAACLPVSRNLQSAPHLSLSQDERIAEPASICAESHSTPPPRPCLISIEESSTVRHHARSTRLPSPTTPSMRRGARAHTVAPKKAARSLARRRT